MTNYTGKYIALCTDDWVQMCLDDDTFVIDRIIYVPPEHTIVETVRCHSPIQADKYLKEWADEWDLIDFNTNIDVKRSR